jgi:arabinan endo-1,5-alpha-L-arabinosidase
MEVTKRPGLTQLLGLGSMLLMCVLLTEMLFAGATSFGGMLVGPPAETTWLRLSHRVDPHNGEHEFRAATSRDGDHWVWGGMWTLPAGTTPRIGLISLGKDPKDSFQATAKFDYFRVYQP